MKLKACPDIITKTFHYKGEWYIDIVNAFSTYEVYIYSSNIGVKKFMYGIIKDITYDEFIEGIINVDDGYYDEYIEDYISELLCDIPE